MSGTPGHTSVPEQRFLTTQAAQLKLEATHDDV